MSVKADVLLADEAPVAEIEEFRNLIAEGQERGFVTIEKITAQLEEVELTKEQISELHHHLDEHGIAIVSADGKPVSSESGKAEIAGAERASAPDGGTAAQHARKKPVST